MNAEVTVLCGKLTRCNKSKMTIDGLCLHLPVVNIKKVKSAYKPRGPSGRSLSQFQ